MLPAPVSSLGLGIALAVVLVFGHTDSAHAAVGRQVFPVGQVVERVTSLDDSAQSYALYLPSAYRSSRRSPVLYLMDPRGRALVPLRLVREVAERFGYIVMSSYNTISDGPVEPNAQALRAMFRDSEVRLSPDVRRLYLVGFSGTARSGWLFGYQYRDHVAGLIGFGAGVPELLFLLMPLQRDPRYLLLLERVTGQPLPNSRAPSPGDRETRPHHNMP